MSILQGLYPLVPHWSHWGAHSTPFHFTSKSCKMQNFFSSWVMSWLQIYMNLLFYTVVPFQKGHNKPVQVMLHLCCFLYMKSHGFMSYFTIFFFFSEIIIETLQKTIKIFLQLFEVKPIISQKIQLTMSKYIVKLSFR